MSEQKKRTHIVKIMWDTSVESGISISTNSAEALDKTDEIVREVVPRAAIRNENEDIHHKAKWRKLDYYKLNEMDHVIALMLVSAFLSDPEWIVYSSGVAGTTAEYEYHFFKRTVDLDSEPRE